MTTAAQQPQPISRGRRIWRGLVSHKPLKRHIDWWLRGLAICSVPLIVGCTIIIGAELAAADWFSTGIGLLVANATEDLLNAAIEGSMLGCIALSKQARKAGDTKQAGTMKWMGLLFAALTVVTVGFRVFHVSPDWGLVLLWVRCGAGIAFCCLSHFNDDDDAEEVTPLQHRTQMEQLTETFNQQVQQLTTEITTLKNSHTEKVTELSRHLADMKTTLETKTAELSHLQNLLSNSQNESSMKAQQYSQNELSLQAKMQADVKAARDEMKAQMKAESLVEMKALQEKIDALSRGNTELKAQLKGQAKTPIKPVKQVSSEKFDTKTFVFSCLQENADMKLSEIVMKAKLQGQELSEPTISRYRKEYRESSTVVKNESPFMKA